MSAVKIRLDQAESLALEHFAEVLGVSTEDVAYAAVHEFMLRTSDPLVQHEVVRLRDSRRQSRPPWTDSPFGSGAPAGDEDEVPPLSRFY
jgi:hypothetical protein